MNQELSFPSRPWPLHPHPLPDETISSWVQRFAAAQGFTPVELMAFLEGVPPRDWVPKSYEAYYPQLARISGVPEIRLRDLTPAGHQHRTSQFVDSLYSCCPACLATDEVPYLRVSWQRSDSFLCPHHRIQMVTGCEVCRKSWRVETLNMRSAAAAEDLRRCPNPDCYTKVDASATEALPNGHPAMWLQEQLHADPAGLAYLRDGRSIQRHLLSWLLREATSSDFARLPLSFDRPSPGRAQTGRPEFPNFMTLAQVLQHPSLEDDLILEPLVQQVFSGVFELFHQVSRKRQEETFIQYGHRLTRAGAKCALFLVWSETASLTARVLTSASLDAALPLYLDDNRPGAQYVTRACDAGLRWLISRSGRPIQGNGQT